MATSARLDELKKKFDESPRRYFAPLANEFRKLGDLTQAVALCRAHLPNQPGHVSGHIVLAQALYEARELGESRLAFEGALDLDPENLIALRYLGDIAREDGTPDVARSWYERVLDADPRNDEIAMLLATLPAASEAPPAFSPPPVADAGAEAAPVAWSQPSGNGESPQATLDTPDSTDTVALETFASVDAQDTPAPTPPPPALVLPDAEAFQDDDFLDLDTIEEVVATSPTTRDTPAEVISFDLVDDTPAEPSRAPTAPASLADPFADAFASADETPSPQQGAISFGDLEAVAEPSDDWFLTPAAEQPTASAASSATEEFFPDLASVTPVSSPAVGVPALDLAAFAAEPSDARAFEATSTPELPLDFATRAADEEPEPANAPSFEAGPSLFDATHASSEKTESVVAHDESRGAESASEQQHLIAAEDQTVQTADAPTDPIESVSPWAATPSLDPSPTIVSESWTFPGEANELPESDEPVTSGASDGSPIEFEAAAEASLVEDDGTASPAYAEASYARTPEWVTPVKEEAPSPFVNETMAELYLKQGHQDEALGIYRQLLSQSPEDQTLRDRVEAIEGSGAAEAQDVERSALPKLDPAGQSARAFFAHFARREPRRPPGPERDLPFAEAGGAIDASPAPQRSGERYDGVATSAEAMTVADESPSRVADSLESLFAEGHVSSADASAAGTLAAAFRSEPAGESTVASSARSGGSGDELSLQHLFGDVQERASGAVSLDEFFSGARRGSEMPAQHDAPAGAERADIEQFTAWLEGLKKK